MKKSYETELNDHSLDISDVNTTKTTDFSFDMHDQFNPQAQSTAYLNDRIRQNLKLNDSVINTIDKTLLSKYNSFSKKITNDNIACCNDYSILNRRSHKTYISKNIPSILINKKEDKENTIGSDYYGDSIIDNQINPSDNLSLMMKRTNITTDSVISTSIIDSFLQNAEFDWGATQLFDKYKDHCRNRHKRTQQGNDEATEQLDTTLKQTSPTDNSSYENSSSNISIKDTNYEDQSNQESKLKANKTILKWMGLPIRSEFNIDSDNPIDKSIDWIARNKLVKSITILLCGTKQEDIRLYIRQDETQKAFFLVDSNGNPTTDEDNNISLQSQEFKRIFVKFLPVSTNYCFGHMIAQINNKKKKVNLFGYLDGSCVQLINEHERLLSTDPVTTSNTRAAQLYQITQRDWLNLPNQPIIIQNTGGYRAFVTIFSNQSNSPSINEGVPVSFYPRQFVLAPRCTQIIQIIQLNNKDQDRSAKIRHNSSTFVQFNVVYVDDDLRRATRHYITHNMNSNSQHTNPESPASNYCVLEDSKYNLFTKLKLFVRLDPNEDKTVPVICSNPYLTDVDWRIALLHQIKQNWRGYCYEIKHGSSNSCSLVTNHDAVLPSNHTNQPTGGRNGRQATASTMTVSMFSEHDRISLSDDSTCSCADILSNNQNFPCLFNECCTPTSSSSTPMSCSSTVKSSQEQLRHTNNSNDNISTEDTGSHINWGVSLNTTLLRMPDTPIGLTSYGCLILYNYNLCDVTYQLEYANINPLSLSGAGGDGDEDEASISSIYCLDKLPCYSDVLLNASKPMASISCPANYVTSPDCLSARILHQLQHTLIPFMLDTSNTTDLTPGQFTQRFRIRIQFSSGFQFHIPCCVTAQIINTCVDSSVVVPQLDQIKIQLEPMRSTDSKYAIKLTYNSPVDKSNVLLDSDSIGSCMPIEISSRQFNPSFNNAGSTMIRSIHNRKTLIYYNSLHAQTTEVLFVASATNDKAFMEHTYLIIDQSNL